MQRKNDFESIASIFEELLEIYDTSKNSEAQNENIRRVFKKYLPKMKNKEIDEFLKTAEKDAAALEFYIQDAKEAAEKYGWSAEIWAYRKMLDASKNMDDDEYDYFEKFSFMLENLADYEDDTINKDMSADAVNETDNRVLEKPKTKAEKEDVIGASAKKSALVHYQKALKIDAGSFDATGRDMGEMAARLSKNAALSGMGQIAITASFAVAANIIKDGNIKNTRPMLKILMKSGLDMGVRQALIGALKIGAEKNLLPMLGRMPSTLTITSIAIITIQSSKVLEDYAMNRINALEAVNKVGRTTTATLLALGLSGAGVSLGITFASALPISLPILSTIVTLSASLTGGIVGNAVAAKADKTLWKSLSYLNANIGYLFDLRRELAATLLPKITAKQHNYA